MLKADYINQSPEINVKNYKWANQNALDIQIGEVESTLSETDAKELHEELDKKLYDESRGNLEEQIENLNEEVCGLRAEIESLKAHIADLEDISMR